MRLVMIALAVTLLVPGAMPCAVGQSLTVGDGVLSVGTYNGNDQVPFEAALAALPRGGTIDLLAGTWTFERPVAVTARGVTISGSAGSVLKSHASGKLGLFHVDGDDFRMTGLRVIVDQAVAQQRLVTTGADSFTVDHCAFELRAGAVDFRVLDLGDGVVQRRGTLIEGNRFLFTEQSAGVVGITLRLGLDLRLCNNEFRKVNGVPVGLCRRAIELYDESKGTMTGNSFQNLGSGPAPMDSVVYSQAETEGHHLAIGSNFFENCFAPSVVHLAGGRFTAITGNVFGRMLESSQGVVRLTASEGGKGGNSNVVTGNQFHNDVLGVYISDQLWNTVQGNQFTICTGPQIRILPSSQGVMVFANQFVGSSGLSANIPYAIEVGGGSDHMIRQNCALSQHPTFGFQSVVNLVTALDITIEDNWKS